MAITLVGVAEASTGSGAVTLTLPGGVAQGDLVVAIGGSVSGANPDVVLSGATGYTELADLYSNDTNDTNMGVYYKLQGATPDTTITISAGAVSHAAVLMVLRGVDLTTPIDATITTATGIDSSLADPPSITTVTDGAWVLACGMSAIADTTVGTPSGYSDQVDITNTNITAMMARKEVTTAGAEDPANFDLTTDAARSWSACTIAIRPAAGAAGGFFARYYYDMAVAA